MRIHMYNAYCILCIIHVYLYYTYILWVPAVYLRYVIMILYTRH